MAKDDSSIFKKADRPKIGGERTGSGGVTFSSPQPTVAAATQPKPAAATQPKPAAVAQPKPEKPRKYLFPPISLLAKPVEPEREIPDRNWQILRHSWKRPWQPLV